MQRSKMIQDPLNSQVLSSGLVHYSSDHIQRELGEGPQHLVQMLPFRSLCCGYSIRLQITQPQGSFILSPRHRLAKMTDQGRARSRQPGHGGSRQAERVPGRRLRPINLNKSFLAQTRRLHVSTLQYTPKAKGATPSLLATIMIVLQNISIGPL